MDITPKSPLGTGWNNLGVRPCANSTGLYHEQIQVNNNPLGNSQVNITDLLNQPISGNPAGNHGHAWNLNTPNPGIRYPNPFQSNK